MKNEIFPAAGLLAGGAILAALTGCMADGSGQVTVYQQRPTVYGQATVSFEDDYDYYPGYETYYSRNRREFVYRDGSTWVRRPEPSGVSISVLLSMPSVRVDFRDSPERHHSTVVRSYPRNWQRSSPAPRVQVQAAVVTEDDYIYYPGYETYYSRNHREYVYREGNTWVRRSQPRGISANVLVSTPSVQVDFRDSPERHHDSVVRSYPKNWKRQDSKQDKKDDDKDERKDRKRG